MLCEVLHKIVCPFFWEWCLSCLAKKNKSKRGLLVFVSYQASSCNFICLMREILLAVFSSVRILTKKPWGQHLILALFQSYLNYINPSCAISHNFNCNEFLNNRNSIPRNVLSDLRGTDPPWGFCVWMRINTMAAFELREWPATGCLLWIWPACKEQLSGFVPLTKL